MNARRIITCMFVFGAALLVSLVCAAVRAEAHDPANEYGPRDLHVPHLAVAEWGVVGGLAPCWSTYVAERVNPDPVSGKAFVDVCVDYGRTIHLVTANGNVHRWNEALYRDEVNWHAHRLIQKLVNPDQFETGGLISVGANGVFHDIAATNVVDFNVLRTPLTCTQEAPVAWWAEIRGCGP